MEGQYTPSEKGTFLDEIRLAFYDWGCDVSGKSRYFFTHFSNLLKNWWKNLVRSDKFQLTLILILVAFMCFAAELFDNGGAIVINGDFKLQGVAFIYNGYDDWHYFFKTGVFPLWDTSGVLGVDNIGAYSFYYLFDPFFLALLIWPRAWLNYVQGVLMIVKIVLAGIFFYDYLGSFKLKDSTKKIGAIAYALCGWGWYYLWFFHMMEAATFLPLMLLGVEKTIQKKDPRLLVFAMFLEGAVNYQFLAVFSVLSFFYAMFRFFQTMKQRNRSENWTILGLGFWAFLTGIVLCGFIIFPSYRLITSMPRIHNTNTFLNVFKEADFSKKLSLLFIWQDLSSGTVKAYQHLYPIESLLFMTNSSFEEPLTKLKNGYYDNAASSFYVSTPILLMLFPSIADAVKKKHVSEIIGIVLVFLGVETPFMYYACGAFSTVPYGRWGVFASLLIVTFVCIHMDEIRKLPGYLLDISLVLVYILFAITVYQCFTWAHDGTYSSYGLQDLTLSKEILGIQVNAFQAQCIFQGIWYFVCYLPLRLLMKRKQFKNTAFILTSLDVIIMGNIAVAGQGWVSYSSSVFGGRESFQQQTSIVEKLKETDPNTFYRMMNSSVSTNRAYDPNLAMAVGYNGLGTFCSTINYDSEDFFEWSKIDRNSNSYTLEYQNKRMNLDEFLGNKYYLLEKSETNVPSWFIDVGTATENEGLSEALKNSKYALYENPYFVDRIFTYSSYIVSDQGSWYFDTDEHHSSAVPEEEAESNYLSDAIVDAEYYKEHQGEFSSFKENKAAMNSALKKASLSGSGKYKTTFYFAKWDVSPETGETSDGMLRTIDKSMSDAEWSRIHQNELAASLDETTRKSVIDGVTYRLTNRTYRYEGGTCPVYCLDSYDRADEYFVSNAYASKSVGDGSWTAESHSNGAYFSKFVTEDPNGEALAAEGASEDNPAYISIGHNMDKANVRFYLYGKNSDGSMKLLCSDQNNYAHTNTNGWRSSSGFYVTEPVYGIIGIIYNSYFNSLSLKNLYYEYFDSFKEQVDVHQNAPVSMDYSKCDANTMAYTTSYTEKKLNVINQLYASGWSLKRTYQDASGKSVTEDVPLFKAQGGFLGYVAVPGENVAYTLTYYTPGLQGGKVLTGLGVLSGASILLWYYGAHQLREQEKRIYKKTGLRK